MANGTWIMRLLVCLQSGCLPLVEMVKVVCPGRELPVTTPLISLDLFGSRKQFGIVASHTIDHVPSDRMALRMSSKAWYAPFSLPLSASSLLLE